jgi:glycosyltransferase involved in cell wall biosynthesis
MAYKHPYTSVYFIGSQSVSDFRVNLAARELKRAGYNAEVELIQVPYYLVSLFDAFVISRPVEPICNFAKVAMEAGKVVIIDMDDDFHRIPKSAPGYNILGPGAIGHENGHPGDYLRELDKAIKNVTGFTCPSAVIGERYGRLDYKLVPNCFDEENEHWTASRLGDPDMFTIGWAGTATHMQDFLMVVPTLRRILQERPYVRLVLGVDEAIYRLFSDIPENQKLFLPGVPYEVYPSIFRYWDVSLAPLEDTLFTRAKSDLKLIETGARGIPFVASPLPQYTAWGVGGLFARTPDEWYEALNRLIDSPELCWELGQAGKEKAWSERTTKLFGERWIEVLEAYL